MTSESLAQEVARQLTLREEKVVFAESCTAGLCAATLGQIPGISNYMCGSAVVYRADIKRRWLGVRRRTIKKFTTESHETAREMAVGIMQRCPEANWGVSIVGHLGPDAPPEKDGLIYICIVRRTNKGNLKIKDTQEHRLAGDGRSKRQKEAVEFVMTHLTRCLTKKSQSEAHKGDTRRKEDIEEQKPKKNRVVAS